MTEHWIRQIRHMCTVREYTPCTDIPLSPILEDKRDLVFTYTKPTVPIEHVRVYGHCSTTSLNKLLFNMIISDMTTHDISHAIIVYDCNVTSAVKSIVKSITDDQSCIELFRVSELSINPLISRFVPYHEKVPSDEWNKHIPDGIQVHKLPIIHHHDIIARYLGFRNGDLIKIIRPDPVNKGNFTIAYRLCK